jgi:hypothetical protein
MSCRMCVHVTGQDDLHSNVMSRVCASHRPGRPTFQCHVTCLFIARFTHEKNADKQRIINRPSVQFHFDLFHRLSSAAQSDLSLMFSISIKLYFRKLLQYKN